MNCMEEYELRLLECHTWYPTPMKIKQVRMFSNSGVLPDQYFMIFKLAQNFYYLKREQLLLSETLSKYRLSNAFSPF